jgi:hypothetical protein
VSNISRWRQIPLLTKNLNKGITKADKVARNPYHLYEEFAISAAFNIKGVNQLPKPPIKIGKNIKENHNKRACCNNYVVNFDHLNSLPALSNSIRTIIP